MDGWGIFSLLCFFLKLVFFVGQWVSIGLSVFESIVAVSGRQLGEGRGGGAWAFGRREGGYWGGRGVMMSRTLTYLDLVFRL